LALTSQHLRFEHLFSTVRLMATRAKLRTTLRERLEDTSGSPLWSDGALNEYLVGALRTYGVTFPRPATAATAALVAGNTGVASPAGVPQQRVSRCAMRMDATCRKRRSGKADANRDDEPAQALIPRVPFLSGRTAAIAGRGCRPDPAGFVPG
jgi:hypothetical protein